MTVEGVSVEGIAVGPVTDWLESNVGLRPPLDFELVAGGRSNLTFKVTDAAGSPVVLRRPPVSHVLPTAHDMAREHRVVTALGPTPVPVARTLGLCLDEDVNGAPFYVMELVRGHVLRDATAAEAVLDIAARRRASESLVEVLADLHAVDVDAVGLGDLGRREGYLSRQLNRWHTQFERSQVEGVERVQAVDRVYERLSEAIPPQDGVTIVHGDYRLDNTMLGDDGAVTAVLDWEICTLGDPLADIGLLMVYWTEAGDAAGVLGGVAPTIVPGFASRAEVRAMYAERTGRDVGGLDYYVAFGFWKLACILQGISSRYLGGAAGGDRSISVEGYATQVLNLAEAASAAADAAGLRA
ncbi:MAG TPA: phosphotransferase family protein [Acidimicrobiales bacterium]|nr:phosphotransferase family protein [Acidimicrobiales bacterium]